jgi:hypothetical protein
MSEYHRGILPVAPELAVCHRPRTKAKIIDTHRSGIQQKELIAIVQ